MSTKKNEELIRVALLDGDKGRVIAVGRYLIGEDGDLIEARFRCRPGDENGPVKSYVIPRSTTSWPISVRMHASQMISRYRQSVASGSLRPDVILLPPDASAGRSTFL